MKRVLSVILACVLLLVMLPVGALAEQVKTTPMYRLYNPNSGEHFYTGSLEEKENLVAAGWNYEGIAWNAPTNSGDPVYRLYNPNSGDHHYTMSAVEREMLVGYGWQYEGVCWNSVNPADKGAVPLFRLYNPNADCGSHHYTNSTEERDNLVNVGWILEGIGWFGMGEQLESHIHDYTLTVVPVTCTTDGYGEYTCAGCGDSYKSNVISAPGHQWKDATCTDAKTCLLCWVTEGSAPGHSYQEGVCTVCGKADPDYVAEDMVWIPTKGGTKYHASAQCSGMEDPEKVALSTAQFLGFTPCKKCYGDTEGFAPIAGIWTMNGLTDDKEELDKIRVIFAEGNVEFWVMYKGLIPEEDLKSALENGYADTDEGRFYYNDIEEYEGNYYFWVGYGSQTSGTYTEEGDLVILTLDGWDEETEEKITSTLTFERTGETTCQVKSIDGIIIDDIVTQAVKNGKVLTFFSLVEEE